ncbi:lipoprotein [Clostridia bacterium]|nr:lipoprotein [Clostridia bacterium]
MKKKLTTAAIVVSLMIVIATVIFPATVRDAFVAEFPRDDMVVAAEATTVRGTFDLTEPADEVYSPTDGETTIESGVEFIPSDYIEYLKISSPDTLTLSAIGDVTLASSYAKPYAGSFANLYDNYGADYFFADVRHIFASDDITVANLECVLSDVDDPSRETNSQYKYKGREEFASVLVNGSIEVVNTLNNHTKDFSEAGYEDTLRALDLAGIDHFGNGRISIKNVNGIKIGFISSIGVSASESRLNGLADQLRYLDSQGVTLKVVTFHWGEMGATSATADQVKIAHSVIDNGADLVLGHHPHVLQGIETYNGKYIAYSLGNFIFDGNVISDIENRTSVIMQVKYTFRDGMITGSELELIPVLVTSSNTYNNFRPCLAEGDMREEILRKIAER